MPRPRKESDVSPRIIPGTASVIVTTIWLKNDGSMCLAMIRRWPAPANRAGHHKIFLANRQQFSSDRARQTRQPMNERMTVIIK